ncbi:MAG TPA: alpha/beta hydrolase [Longimicrobiales bacterium]|nr:alpha/beta hydrolase [Longimicrobiales bacterium]
MRRTHARQRSAPSALPSSLLAGLLLLPSPCPLPGQNGLEDFDGSYRLETGEVVTGGYMVEGEGFWIFMDTRGLDRGGVFAREGDRLRSTFPADGAVRIDFERGTVGRYDRLTWHERGRALRGERVFPHTSRPVKFPSADGTELLGRLLLPDCDGPHPAIVMVHGSGPANRYGGVFHTFLLQRGVAVLAYDKRGYTPDADAWREPDFAAMSDDAAAAVEFAAALPEVDAARVGLWGSSQGGWTVPPAAIAAPHTSYMILRAGATLPGPVTVIHEQRQEVRAAGVEGLDLDHAMDLREHIYRLAAGGAPIAAADSAVAPYVGEHWYRTAFGDGPISEVWSAEWWGWAQRNLAFGSTDAVARFGGPVLWFLGERDEAVPLVPTRAALERAFARSPGGDQRVVVVPDAPHSFMIPSENGPPRYAEGVFGGMEDWLAERGFTDEACWR